MAAIIHPIAEYVLLAVGLILCTLLFFTLKQDLYRVSRRLATQQQKLGASVEQLRAEISAMKTSLGEVEKKAGELPQLSPPRPGMNTARRTQVLRMFHRGEQPEQIAAALGLAQGEVDLLLKVHQAAQSA